MVVKKIEQYRFEQLFIADNNTEKTYNKNSMVILGDCLNVLGNIKNSNINLIFADAPYNIGKNFGNNKDKWKSVDLYIDWCKQWIDECMRVLKNEGTMYLMTATQHMPFLDVYISEKYNVLCRIVWLALQLIDKDDKEPIIMATVNLPKTELEKGEIIIKDWSENTGILDFLISEGLVEDTGKLVFSGYAVSNIVKITKKLENLLFEEEIRGG